MENTLEWEPCEDLMGVLTQIDNMIVGLKRRSILAKKARQLFWKLIDRVFFL